MSIPNDTIMTDIEEAWRTYMNALEESIHSLELQLDEAAEMAGICSGEWCEAIEHVIDELGNSLFSISEPRWTSQEDSKKLKRLKRRLYDLYANYRETYNRAA